MYKQRVYTKTQVEALTEAVKQICELRHIDPLGKEGRDVAARLIEECSGNESREEMIQKFKH